jgi:hypothetical protein
MKKFEQTEKTKQTKNKNKIDSVVLKKHWNFMELAKQTN